MIEFNGKHKKCLDCGNEWNSNFKTKKCSFCGVPADHFRRRKNYSSEKKNLYITLEVKERLLRRRDFPSESFASVVDRLQANELNLSIVPPRKDEYISISITVKAFNNIEKIREKYGYTSMNEVVWRQL